jgi:putative toxin-antitoxin system antitoxin component (TIGR02293 family)
VTLIERLKQAAKKVELDESDLARLLETSPKTISRWRNRSAPPPPGARERLLELVAVLELLSGTLKPRAARQWLFTPCPSLDNHKPVELLNRGDVRPVLGAIDVMGDGVFV